MRVFFALLATATLAGTAVAADLSPARKEQCATHYLTMAVLVTAGRPEGSTDIPPKAAEFADRSVTTLGVSDFSGVPDAVKNGVDPLLKALVESENKDAMKAFADVIRGCDAELGLAPIAL
jgi:hypothetical protein